MVNGLLINLFRFGETALHYASRNGDAKVCELLMSHSADLSICSRDGTPIDISANPDIKNLLINGNFILQQKFSFFFSHFCIPKVPQNQPQI